MQIFFAKNKKKNVLNKKLTSADPISLDSTHQILMLKLELWGSLKLTVKSRIRHADKFL